MSKYWVSVNKRLPEVGVYVLVAIPSGYIGTPYRFSEAKYDPDWKGWTNVSGDRIADYGDEPRYWKELPIIGNKTFLGYDISDD